MDKESVREFWEEAPCGTRDVNGFRDDSASAFRELERQRDAREPFIASFAKFAESAGKLVLEVGVGAGTDHIRFARAGAKCTGIDLTSASIETTKKRFALEGLTSDLRVGDAEDLPFKSNQFDVVYSWGVIHHSPDPAIAAREILRVLKPGGRFCVMVYNRRSLLALQAWVAFAAAKGYPGTSIRDVIANHVESPGTQAYTRAEASALFADARDVRVDTLVTPYDMRIGRRTFLPKWTWRLAPRSLGWFHIITGTK